MKRPYNAGCRKLHIHNKKRRPDSLKNEVRLLLTLRFIFLLFYFILFFFFNGFLGLFLVTFSNILGFAHLLFLLLSDSNRPCHPR